MTLRDLYLLCERYVPRASRHEHSLDAGRGRWWPAHEIGHLLTTERWRHGRLYFDLHELADHEMRCRELAAMSVSRRLLEACGRPDLVRAERVETDTNTLYWDDRGRVRRILRRFRVIRLPRTREGLERKLQRAVAEVRS